jgi:hypothetical protein
LWKGFHNVFETNFGLVHTPDRTKANMRAYMWDQMKDWLLHGAIEADEFTETISLSDELQRPVRMSPIMCS